MTAIGLMVWVLSGFILQPGAARVFLDFISYSAGPLPRELLDLITCPVSILWGASYNIQMLAPMYTHMDMCIRETVP